MNLIRIYLSLLVLVSVFYVHGQLTPHLDYDTPYERTLFTTDNTSDVFSLLNSMGKGASHERTLLNQKKIDEFIQKIEGKVKKEKDDKKRIAFLHKAIHSEFLKTYEEVSEFHRIFEDGQYNCVSGSALFALVFEAFNIPYQLKEKPDHVYIVAYPQTLGIMVESTLPKNGYYMPRSRDIEKIVKMMVRYNALTEQEVQEKGYEQVFNALYYKDKNITLNEITGIQYYNEALVQLRQENFRQAFNALTKASYLYPSFEMTFLKYYALDGILPDAKFDDYEEAYMLLEYMRLPDSDLENCDNGIRYLFYNQLIKENRKEFTDSVYQIMKGAQLRDSIQHSLDKWYYLSASEYYFIRKSYNYALDQIQKAYKVDKNDSLVQVLYAKCLFNSFVKKEMNEELVLKLDEQAQNAQFLKFNGIYQMLYFYVYAEISGDAYFENDGKTGDQYFIKAESILNKLEDKAMLDPYYFGMLYAEAGAYYYRKGNYQKALSIIDQGIVYAPGHERLESRREIILKRMN